MASILTVEPKDELKNTIGRRFEDLGYEILTLHNGVEAVELYRANSKDISLVLCDYDVPKLDGIETISQIKQINPSSICYLTTDTSNDTDFSNRAYERGADLVIFKPLRFEMLYLYFAENLKLNNK
ncbi:response regulator [Candidatus Woesearchaeota archaeon]|nr:response regulator [Candidatus Woesearchaeota archaeon]